LLELLDFLTTITATIFFAIVVLSQVLKKGPITPHRIQGAIAVYLLLGFAWAHVYALIEYLSPGAFTGAVSASGRFTSWMYFSFVTLATLGYGDIAPLHPIARSLATAEAITGQLYLAILIARLVSQELHHRTSTIEDDSKDKTPPKS
jgi:Na+/H+-dicarboxylate symporter